MFESLPREIQEYIYSFLSVLERMKMAQVNKKFNKQADDKKLWKLDCQKEGIPIKEGDDYKALFKMNFFLKKKYIITNPKDVYYILGNSILLTYESVNLFADRLIIPKDKIVDSFPLKKQIKVFRTLEDAAKFSNKIETYKYDRKSSSCAIFAINLRCSIKVFLEYGSHREKPFNFEGLDYCYFETEIKNISNVFQDVLFMKHKININSKISIKKTKDGHLVRAIEPLEEEKKEGRHCHIM